MTNEKQIQANRRNAQKSTGPKTAEGKGAVRHNALKHGLLAQDVVVFGESRDELRELGERLLAELQPEGELEEQLVDQIIAAYWRLRRLRRVEVGIFDVESRRLSTAPFAQTYSQISMLGLSFMRDANGANALSKLSRYEIAIERSFYRALHELQRLQAARRAEGDVPPPLPWISTFQGVPVQRPEMGLFRKEAKLASRPALTPS